MTNYEYLQNISLPKLAAILGYIADTIGGLIWK